MRDEDIPALFEARLNFYEAGRIFYNRLSFATPAGEEQQDHHEEATMYAMQSRALLMTGPELKAVAKNARGILANALSDEFDRRATLTAHQGLRETVARTKARLDLQLRTGRIPMPLEDREIEMN